MTIIAAYVNPDGSGAMGCDTSMTTGACFDAGSKIVRLGPALVGLAGDALWRRFLRTADPVNDEEGVHALADAWTAWARERGHGEIRDCTKTLNAAMVVLLPGRIWLVSGDGSVTEPTEGYHATGSGIGAGMAALWTARQLDQPADRAVALAVGAAIAHGDGCSGRCVVETLPPVRP
jgi:ATP-dependent protease HslVU (ClpYQ) peptidase subunit